jgi:hypothetical protein
MDNIIIMKDEYEKNFIEKIPLLFVVSIVLRVIYDIIKIIDAKNIMILDGSLTKAPKLSTIIY